MCDISDDIEKRKAEKDIEKAIEKRIKEEFMSIMSDAVRSLMEVTHWTAEQTLTALKVPEDEHPAYIKLLNEQSEE